MSPRDPVVQREKSQLGVAVRRYGPTSPEAVDRRRRLEALNAAKRVDDLVASWPALSEEKLNRIAGLLRAGARDGEAQT